MFHPTDQLLVTASEDSTLKVWSLQKATQSSRNNRIVDLEPTQTFRGHTGAVLCVGVSEDGSTVYSGGVDTSIRVWKLPSEEADPFDSYGKCTYSVKFWTDHFFCHPCISPLIKCSYSVEKNS